MADDNKHKILVEGEWYVPASLYEEARLQAKDWKAMAETLAAQIKTAPGPEMPE